MISIEFKEKLDESLEIMIDDIMKENHYMQSKHEFNFNETMGNYIKLFI